MILIFFLRLLLACHVDRRQTLRRTILRICCTSQSFDASDESALVQALNSIDMVASKQKKVQHGAGETAFKQNCLTVRNPLAQAFGSSCFGSKAHQRAVGGQLKGSCSLSYFPVGSERC